MAEDSRKERLEAVVAAYGTDVRRWPPADRALAPAGSGINEIAGAREAAALDRLFGSSVVDDEATTADADLMDRILARATQGGAVSTAAANDDLASLGGHAAGSKSTALQSRWSSRTSCRAPAAAALMAASLALGIFVGSLQSTQSTVARIGTLAGLDIAGAVPSTAFEDDFLAQDEEDIL
jgi:hypothetical protein